MFSVRKLFVALALVVVAMPAIMPTAMAQTLVFTAIPDQDETRLRERFGKVADYLKQKLGVDVSYVPVKSYAAAVTAFKNDQVQLAWFGGLSGVRARQLVSGSEAIAQGYEDQFFVTYFIANTSTGLSYGLPFPEGMKGKTFTFGSKGSTSGRLMPEFHIREAFKDSPNKVFSRVGFSGDHSRTIALVQSGAFDVGALNYKTWESEAALGKIDPGKVQVIWQTPTYPDYQWSIRGDVDARFGAGFKDKVRDALIAIKDPKILEAFPRQSFVRATNADYQPIVDTAKAIGLID